ncbi:MAG: hypothetical protein ACRDH2_19245 [Anaerolineales bacterium]
MTRVTLLAALLLSACAADKAAGPGLTVADLAGTWAVTRWQRLNAANPNEREDVLPTGGTASLVINRTGAFSFTVVIPGQGTFTETGTLSIKGDTLTYDGENDEVLFRITRRGDPMGWRALEPELNDVNNDGVPEDSIEEVEFVRR